MMGVLRQSARYTSAVRWRFFVDMLRLADGVWSWFRHRYAGSSLSVMVEGIAA